MLSKSKTWEFQSQLLKSALHNAFKIKDMRVPKYFLGLDIARYSTGISVVGMLACKPCYVPMNPIVHLSKDSGTLLDNETPYRELIGRLLYLSITRPDITFVVNKLSQFLSCPTDIHLAAAHRVLRYIKANPGQGLFFTADSELCLNAFADVD